MWILSRPVSSRIRSMASSIASTWSLSERSRPPSSCSGAPKSTTQGSTPLRARISTALVEGATS